MTSRDGQLDGLAGTGHGVRAAAADLDRAVGRRPLRDRAGQAGQRRLDRGSRRAPVRWRASARPRGRRSSTTPRSRPSRGTPCGRRGGTRRRACAWPRKTGSTPDANGSSVPPWPTRFVAASRRTRATTSCEVGPAGLATTRMPSSPGPSDERATSALERGDEPGGLGEDRRSGVLDAVTRSRRRRPGRVRRPRTGRSGPSRRRRRAWSGR